MQCAGLHSGHETVSRLRLIKNNIVFKDNAEDWNALCSLACRHGVPYFTNASMLPFINVEPKKHTAKQRAPRKTNTDVSFCQTTRSLHTYVY